MNIVLLTKLVSVSPLVMLNTEIPRSNLLFTKTFLMTTEWLIHSFQDVRYFFRRIWRGDASVFPHVLVMSLHVFGIVFHQLKVLNSVIISNMVLMMNSLRWFQRSTNMLLHDISMVKDSFSAYIYSEVSKWSKKGLSFFKVLPIRGNFVISMTHKPKTMCTTNLPILYLEYTFASVYSANFSLSHITNHNS